MRTVTVANETLLPEVSGLLSQGNSVTIKAKGNSMLPFIVGGRDSVVLQKAEKLSPGDVVLAEVAPGRFVLHRILKIENGMATLMGDGNLWETERCTVAAIHGRGVAIVRKGKPIRSNRKSERIKVYAWQNLLPLRRYLLAIYRKIGQL